ADALEREYLRAREAAGSGSTKEILAQMRQDLGVSWRRPRPGGGAGSTHHAPGGLQIMSDTTEAGTAPAEPAQPAEPQEGQQGKQPETFDAEYVAKLRREAARYRTEAKANAEAAKRLAEIEEAGKSEAEKAAERVAEAERRAAEAEARVLRREIALEHKLDKDDAALLDALTDEDAMRSLAKRLAVPATGKNYVPREGTTTTTTTSGTADEREFVRE